MSRAISRLGLLCLLLLAAGVLPAQTLYWGSPAVLDRQGVRWSSSAMSAGSAILMWEEIVPTPGKSEGVIYLSAARSLDGVGWSFTRRFAGPIRYSGVNPGQEPQVYSMATDSRGQIYVAALTAEKEVTILSADHSLAFQSLARISTPLTSVTVSLSATRTDSLLLLTTQAAFSGAAQTASTLAWSWSQDGRSWASFAPFISAGDLASGIQLQPDHVASGAKDIVVFQSQQINGINTDIYSRTSADGGRTWGPTQAVTSLPAFNETVGTTAHPASEFDNTRPRLFANGAALTLLWERNLLGPATRSLYSVALDANGLPAGAIQSLTPGAASIFGQQLSLGSRTFLLYAQSAGGISRVVLSEKTGDVWNPVVLGRTLGGSSQFPHAIMVGDAIHVFWENGPAVVTSGSESSLIELKPKTSVLAPDLIAVGFTPGKPERSDSATVRWAQPSDSVGIDAYEVTVRLNGTAVPPVHTVTADPDSPNASFSYPFPKDGTWRFDVVAMDIAHNRSPAATMEFIRDTTPPHPVTMAPLSADSDGFLRSNSFAVSWSPSPDADVAGYAWEEQAVAATVPEYQPGNVAVRPPPARVMTTATALSFNNLENGVHILTVEAVDAAGNVSEPATMTVFLNKFKPFTAVYALLQKADDQGNVSVTIRGRGFLTNGALQEIYLSRNAKAPYDHVLKPGNGGFTVVNDNLVTGLVLDNTFASGTYRVGLSQPPALPLFWPGGSITFESPGTVHFGSFAVKVPRWLAGTTPRYNVSFNALLVVLVVTMLAVILVFSIRRLASLAQEGALLRSEITALIEGKPTAGWAERNRVMQELKRRGVSLRIKFTLLMVVLVIIIVLIVSIPLGVRMISDSGRNLANELQKRTRILISTMAANAQVEIQKGTDIATGGLSTIASVPENKNQMPEAIWATITGPGAGTTDATSREYVWASNEDKWSAQKNKGTFAPAAEAENDALSPLVPQLQRSVNDAAQTSMKDLVDKWRALRDRYDVLNAKATRSAAENAELKTVLQSLGPAKSAIDAGAKSIPEANGGSLPPFDATHVAPSYLFYQPIVYFSTADKTLYQGLVRMQVDTTAITKQIRDSQRTLVVSTALIALLAIALGVVGAIIMASITITPIRKLAQGVTYIGSTEDKEQLKEYSIAVRSRDEIGQLADTVNDMTRGLVKAAIANKELMVGKDIQKMFLPLEKDRENRKGTTGGEETKAVEIYGYYEGAKGVSGDYFDFRRLDESHYALIKCDVAGKGVSAALIMVEVATLFASFARDWQRRREAVTPLRDPAAKQKAMKELERIDQLVYTINDSLEERGFKGRFAALTICLFNAETGVMNVCNAGDTLMHVYDTRQHRMEIRKLPDAPAAGVFPSMLVEMKSGFKQVPHSMEHGDALFLFTDGFEEAKRSFRNAAWEVVPCDAPGLKEGEQHGGTHAVGATSEEFGVSRIEGIVNAVFSRGRYVLERHHSPDASEELTFDFSTCTGSVKEAVLALVAVEKVFRLVPDPRAGEKDSVHVDALVDTFLQSHFLQFRKYFTHKADGQNGSGSVTYTHVREDEQYDDLTLLVIRRK